VIAVKLRATAGSGWLLLGGSGNEFYPESISMTEQNLFNLFGCRVLAVINVSNSEFRRMKRECGVR